jgi:hypothetical protein
MAPPFKKGQSGNPAGKASRREILARDLLERAGLHEIAHLAYKLRKGEGAVAAALYAMASDKEDFRCVQAQRLLWDLVGARDKAEAAQELGVAVRHKVRVMDVEEGNGTDKPHEGATRKPK